MEGGREGGGSYLILGGALLGPDGSSFSLDSRGREACDGSVSVSVAGSVPNDKQPNPTTRVCNVFVQRVCATCVCVEQVRNGPTTHTDVCVFDGPTRHTRNGQRRRAWTSDTNIRGKSDTNTA